MRKLIMSRPLRIEYAGAWYHVMNRGRRGEEIYSERNDYRLFIEILEVLLNTPKIVTVDKKMVAMIPNHAEAE
jgi:putative transposase